MLCVEYPDLRMTDRRILCLRTRFRRAPRRLTKGLSDSAIRLLSSDLARAPVAAVGKRGVSMEINIFDMLADSFGPVIAILVVLALSIIAIFRLGLKFDLNSYLGSRKKRHLGLARLECPHMALCKTENGISFRSLFVSPPGTLSYQCQQCGLITNRPPSDGEFRQIAESMANDLHTYKKRMHRFEKHMKKSL